MPITEKQYLAVPRPMTNSWSSTERWPCWKKDPFHPSLRLHPLQGRLAGLHAVSINLQYRITLELELRAEEIILVAVGSHGEMY